MDASRRSRRRHGRRPPADMRAVAAEAPDDVISAAPLPEIPSSETLAMANNTLIDPSTVTSTAEDLGVPLSAASPLSGPSAPRAAGDAAVRAAFCPPVSRLRPAFLINYKSKMCRFGTFKSVSFDRSFFFRKL